MYGLESFDSQIKALYDDIAEIEDEKQSALEDFEKNTKADIISEINERYADKICNMETENQMIQAHTYLHSYLF